MDVRADVGIDPYESHIIVGRGLGPAEKKYAIAPKGIDIIEHR